MVQHDPPLQRDQQAARKWKSSETDPRHIYHNLPISLDESRNLNNGRPGSLPVWIDALELKTGERVYYLGGGVEQHVRFSGPRTAGHDYHYPYGYIEYNFTKSGFHFPIRTNQPNYWRGSADLSSSWTASRAGVLSARLFI
jgi:hypothetical protein